jgi:hypothetical protein
MGAVRHMSASSGADDADIQQIVDAARSALDQEFSRAERYDLKSRNQITLAGSWFAVVQAVVAVAVGPSTSSEWIAAVLVAAAVAAGALILAIIACAKVWQLKEQAAINHETLEDMLDAATSQQRTFRSDLVQLYRNLLAEAQLVNEKRATALESSLESWWWALALGFVELGVALISRITSG